jgi:Ca2+-dependent lipid-binding protein
MERQEDIDPQVYVKLHNVSFAMDKLKEMYGLMNVAKINQTLLQHRATVAQMKTPDASTRIKGQFVIHVSHAENLKPTNKNGLSNPYVIIRVPEGTVVTPQEQVHRAQSFAFKHQLESASNESIVVTGNACELFRYGAIYLDHVTLQIH